jgi:hypothetical protein
MFVVRSTKKLQQRLGVARLDAASAAPPTNALGAWYANVVAHHRRTVVLFVSELTLLPVVVTLAPSASLFPRFAAALGELLIALGIERDHVRAELTEMTSWCLAATESRRVVGSLNDFAWLLEAVPQDETLLGASLGLAEAPCSPIGGQSPRNATRALFEPSPRSR